jgi:hypothetical protein
VDRGQVEVRQGGKRRRLGERQLHPCSQRRWAAHASQRHR